MTATEPLDSLDAETLDALLEHVSRIKHDLGKYVAFQIRWIAPEASLDERREALAADILATRRGPEGERDAGSLWAEVRPALVGEAPLANGARVQLANDPAVVAIDRGVAVVVEVARELPTAGDEVVSRGTEAALQIAEACRDLHRRVTARRGC